MQDLPALKKQLNSRTLEDGLNPNVATRRRQHAGRGRGGDSWIGKGAGLVRITRLALDPFDRRHREIGRPTL